MHLTRLIIAALFIPLFYVLVKSLPPWVFTFLVLIGIQLGQYEFYRLRYPENKIGLILMGGLGGGLITWHFHFQGLLSDREVLSMIIVGLLLFELFVRREMSVRFPDAAVGLLGILYVGWLLGHLILIRNIDQGENLILFLFLVTWTADAGAYYIGKGLGRRPLAPKVSPNKTWEGAIGGLIAGLVAAWFGRAGWLPMLSAYDSLVLGLLLGGLGQLGDLVESMFKRSAAVKDSSRLIPGHGGMLDKVDSLIFTAPAFYYYLLWVKQFGRVIVI